jgi:hypothetical protein
VRRFLRGKARLLLVTAALGAVIGVVRTFPRQRTDSPGDGIRTGSFDTWPAVPVAPGRAQSAD